MLSFFFERTITKTVTLLRWKLQIQSSEKFIENTLDMCKK